MKERPILFSTPMVQAILDGRKTMTRRAIKENPLIPFECGEFLQKEIKDFAVFIEGFGRFVKMYCPYGKPGDVLWVRETWCEGFTDGEKYHYKANDKNPEEFKKQSWKWKPSIHMPREACRLRLLIKSIRVERLQDITEEDAIKEGAKHGRYLGVGQIMGSVREGFFELWDTIKGSDSVFSNPWVWVIEFEKL